MFDLQCVLLSQVTAVQIKKKGDLMPDQERVHESEQSRNFDQLFLMLSYHYHLMSQAKALRRELEISQTTQPQMTV